MRNSVTLTPDRVIIDTATGSPVTEERLLDEVDTLLEQTLNDDAQRRVEAEQRLRKLYYDLPYYENMRERIRDAYHLGMLIEHGILQVCEKCGEIFPDEIGYWPSGMCNSRHMQVVGGDQHGRVIARQAKGAPDTVFYYNPRTKDVYMPGHDTQHASPESRGYIKQSIGVRQYGLKSRFYRFLDRLAVDRRWKRLEKEESMFGPMMKENRARLSRRLQTQFGREMMEEAIAKSNRSAEQYESYSPGSHIEAWEFDEAHIKDGSSNDPLPSLRRKQLEPEVARVNAKRYKGSVDV